jgi:hypothetical protein
VTAPAPEVDLLEQIESGAAPRRVLEFAARGMVPLPPGELVRALATVILMRDSALTMLAEKSLKDCPPKAWSEAIASPGVRPEQLDVLARRTADPELLEPLIRHRAVRDGTLVWLAERIEPALQEILVTNQTRLLGAPLIVERLFENPHLSADIRRRADEFVEEFFLKKERELDEAADAPEPEVSPEVPAPTAAADRHAPVDADAVLSEEVEKSLISRLATMSVAQRIRLAYRGNKEERLFLIRDSNRLVAAAVLKSPRTREADVEVIAKMKSVTEDVLRIIASRKSWMRKYSILESVVKNPRSPINLTLPFVIRLTHKDQKALANDRNVPEALRSMARREVARRED